MNAEARSTFPNPPELWRLYTDEAVESAEGILNQPPPPIQGNFSKFGMPYTNDYWIHDLGDVPKLFDEDVEKSDLMHRIQFVPELRRLLHEIGSLFSEMLEQFQRQPELVEGTVQRISFIFSNMAHLLNLLRAHQARQSIICSLSHQIESRNEKTKELEQLIEKCQSLLQNHRIL